MGYTLTDYAPYDFALRRHIGPSPSETDEMLKTLNVSDLDRLIDDVLPPNIRQKNPLITSDPMSEWELLDYMRDIANMNRVQTSLIGQGYYDTFTPPAIARNIFENPAWYTAYTPYQPEISQGRLEALLNYQTMIIDLTGLEIANASLLDEATACAEAMVMAKRIAKSKAQSFFIDENCHPQNIDVMRTRAQPLGIDLIIGKSDEINPSDVFGAIVQYPGTYGHIRDYTDIFAALHSHNSIAIMAADPLALTLLKEPGTMGADIVVGSTQRFGVPLGYGGPHAAYMATRDIFKRFMPGRIIGVSIDTKGNKAYRLALQTREQHIRREKATSNVCTAQALLAVMASMYGVFHGPDGLKAIAQRIHMAAAKLASGLELLGFKIIPDSFFDTFIVDVGGLQSVVLKSALNEGINLRAVGTNYIGISLDEMSDQRVLSAVWRAFGLSVEKYPKNADYRLPSHMARTTTFMDHPIFHMNRSEAEMTRYIRRLSDRDLALDRTMIPLGSCTMKLNATAEMMPVSWPGFSRIHPFAPKSQTMGYELLIKDLSDKLCKITGYDGISMQPNSGAQGEYAGLMTIRRYHESNQQGHRNICLIPMSAHGTNPASAQMVGYKVIAIKTALNGDIDVDDFREKAQTYRENLAACMITYPSTHGVFEEGVHEICAITHEHGGQVYMDGANLNAMVGLAQPGKIGSDVSHLNLHKTFCIPHGGGGPGMGPIGVKKHLIPHLPGHISQGTTGAVSAAQYGSPSILPISWAYCLLMGSNGLTAASKFAILNANYVAKRLSKLYKILYKGPNGYIAHECIIDTRPLAEYGITVDDIAKRLIDCGFHAPTMSFPVAGTLMIEPTESEPKAELDRFCDAMIGIWHEAQAVKNGKFPKDNNPLCNAPHTMEDLIGEWDRPYTRKQACFPAGSFKVDKYWAPVNRVDNVHGDKNLICSCPPMDSYADSAE